MGSFARETGRYASGEMLFLGWKLLFGEALRGHQQRELPIMLNHAPPGKRVNTVNPVRYKFRTEADVFEASLWNGLTLVLGLWISAHQKLKRTPDVTKTGQKTAAVVLFLMSSGANS